MESFLKFQGDTTVILRVYTAPKIHRIKDNLYKNQRRKVLGNRPSTCQCQEHGHQRQIDKIYTCETLQTLQNQVVWTTLQLAPGATKFWQRSCIHVAKIYTALILAWVRLAFQYCGSDSLASRIINQTRYVLNPVNTPLLELVIKSNCITAVRKRDG